jgi:ribosome-binding ATPase YchF (GTP1/OBG family)
LSTSQKRITSAKRINGAIIIALPYPPSNAEQLHARLPKIKAWIDANNPGDPLIPFSVALEERLAPLTAEEKEEEQKKAGAQSALGKITQAGYSSLDVRLLIPSPFLIEMLMPIWCGAADSILHMRP